MIGNGVEEVAIMGDEQQCTRVGTQPVLQPQHRVEVEVVGGLVEQQQIGAAHQGPRQVKTHAPAAGEAAHRHRFFCCAESQAVHQFARTAVGGVAADDV